MRIKPEDRIKYAILGVFALGLGYYGYTQLFPSEAPPPPAAVVTTVAPPVKTAAAKPALPSGNTVGVSSKAGANSDAPLDPTLHMEAMLVTESLVYSGSGRNIFSPNSAPAVVIPKLVAKVRTPELVAPVRTGPVGPPPPPPIDLKFFGIATAANGNRQAFLLHGEDVFIASAGEIVQRRYRVISIDAHSIVIEDIPNSNQQTLPLQMH